MVNADKIHKWITDTESISESDRAIVASITERFPYFVPGRYLEAVLDKKLGKNVADSFYPGHPYMGNWMLFHKMFYGNAVPEIRPATKLVKETAKEAVTEPVKETVKEPVVNTPTVEAKRYEDEMRELAAIAQANAKAKAAAEKKQKPAEPEKPPIIIEEVPAPPVEPEVVIEAPKKKILGRYGNKHNKETLADIVRVAENEPDAAAIVKEDEGMALEQQAANIIDDKQEELKATVKEQEPMRVIEIIEEEEGSLFEKEAEGVTADDAVSMEPEAGVDELIDDDVMIGEEEMDATINEQTTVPDEVGDPIMDAVNRELEIEQNGPVADIAAVVQDEIEVPAIADETPGPVDATTVTAAERESEPAAEIAATEQQEIAAAASEEKNETSARAIVPEVDNDAPVEDVASEQPEAQQSEVEAVAQPEIIAPAIEEKQEAPLPANALADAVARVVVVDVVSKQPEATQSEPVAEIPAIEEEEIVAPIVEAMPEIVEPAVAPAEVPAPVVEVVNKVSETEYYEPPVAVAAAKDEQAVPVAAPVIKAASNEPVAEQTGPAAEMPANEAAASATDETSASPAPTEPMHHEEILPWSHEENILQPIKEEEEEALQQTNTGQVEPLIQPVYAEDYFRHMGVSVPDELPEINKEEHKAEMVEEEDDDEDKSLLVMMSFSEWLQHLKIKSLREKEEEEDKRALRTMWKKEKLAAALEEENEEIPEQVFEMAVNSIMMEDSMISESLAEIYTKQGKYDKAIEMYHKLSLRDTKKSTYFATQIEKIKKQKES